MAVLITDGRDGMIPLGITAVALTALGAVAGLFHGSRTHGRHDDHGTALAVTSMAAVLAIVALLVFMDARLTPGPILDARECFEVYELLGSTKMEAIRELPLLTPNQAGNSNRSWTSSKRGRPMTPSANG